MDVFRVRKVKETAKTIGGTLDSVHREIVNQIQNPDTKKETALYELTKTLETLREGKNDIDAFHVELQINEHNSKKTTLEDYYLQNSDILLKYYGATESLPVPTPAIVKETNTFMKFFVDKISSADIGVSKKQIFDEYMVRMKFSAGTESTSIPTEHCMDCNISREEVVGEGILVCPNCGSEEYSLVVSDFPSFNDPPKERNNYAYKKGNHLNEILNQFQAKESTLIPEEVMNEIILEIRKRRVENIADMTEDDVRQILKKLGRSKYYEHRIYILSRLNGNPPPMITPEIEEKIRSMFQEIQAPFLNYCPPDRTNFLSYSYILFKFIELLELEEYKVFFPLLKSRDRLIDHDYIWKKICEDLRWEFIPSV